MLKKISGLLFLLSAVALLCFQIEGTASECSGGEWRCSGDAYVLSVCENGAWKDVSCMKEQGKLCEDGSCVDPWKSGAPEWPRVENESRATKETLSEKAGIFEEAASRLLVHPQLKWMQGAELPCRPAACGDGDKPPCEDCSLPAVSWNEATWKDVVRWHSNENDGLWSALYMAAEAFRYSVTRDERALAMLKLLLEGEVTRMRITGVPGIFTRMYVPPGIPGLSPPEGLESYIPDREKDENMWVRVGDDGCVQYVDAKTHEWTPSSHCGLDRYAGWHWLDNVSKDEYSGHIFALGAVAKLVDDPQVQSVVKDLLGQVAGHLMKTGMAFTDWDGRICEHGRIHAATFGDYPGFNAAMGLDFIKVAADVTGDPEVGRWYDDCLLQKGGNWNCLKKAFEAPKPYTEYLRYAGMYPGSEGCKANYNNTSMHMLSMHNLIWYEREPGLREAYQRSLDEDVVRAAGQPRAVINQNNAFFDFIWAAHKKLGPDSDGPAYAAVENGIRMLRQYPAVLHQTAAECPPEKCREYCRDRFDRPVGNYPREIAERCIGVFVWWGDPYQIRKCSENQRIVVPPTGFLLPYWMGRYYGFITENM